MAKQKKASNSFSEEETKRYEQRIERKKERELKVKTILDLLDVKSNDILSTTIVSKFVGAIDGRYEIKEFLDAALDLCHSRVAGEAYSDKVKTLKTVEKYIGIITEETTSANEDRVKQRTIRNINNAIDKIYNNQDKKISLVVCSTKKQEDLLYAADNSHGIIDTLLNKRSNAMKRGDLEADAEATSVLTNLLSEMDKASETLNSMVNHALAKGHGTFEQLSTYGRKIMNENNDSIIEDVKKGLSAGELAKKYNILEKTLVLAFNKTIKNGLLESFKDEIIKLKESNLSHEEILSKVKLDSSLISKDSLESKIKSWTKQTPKAKKTTASNKVAAPEDTLKTETPKKIVINKKKDSAELEKEAV